MYYEISSNFKPRCYIGEREKIAWYATIILYRLSYAARVLLRFSFREEEDNQI